MGYQHSRAVAALLGIATVLAACTTPVAGHPVAADGHSSRPSASPTKPARPQVSARDLLLREGEQTPLGPAVPAAVGDTFFTSVRPPQCAPALLFKGSPLPPHRSSDHAESAYTFGGSAIYAESADVYSKALNPHDVVWNGFGAVAKCNAEAVGVASVGESGAMQLREFAVPADGVLAWVMAGEQETCDYGLAVIPEAALLMVACDTEGRVDMKEWAPKRRAQMVGHS